jgi:hypothetical protein
MWSLLGQTFRSKVSHYLTSLLVTDNTVPRSLILSTLKTPTASHQRRRYSSKKKGTISNVIFALIRIILSSQKRPIYKKGPQIQIGRYSLK